LKRSRTLTTAKPILKDTKIAKLNTALVQQRLRDAIKNTLDDLLGLDLGKAHFIGNRLGHVFLGHEKSFPGR
jgi:hypothetical protein